MRELLWITERELRERRLVLVGAFLIGLLTLATPLLPRLRSEKPLYLINTGATIMGVAISVAVAILAGASAIGRDLAERRLGFYFSKPLGSMSIWGGKMLGALLLAVVSGLLVVLPATLLGGGLIGGFSAGRISFGGLHSCLGSWPTSHFSWPSPMPAASPFGPARSGSFSMSSCCRCSSFSSGCRFARCCSVARSSC
jgi:ABC-type transport system involved in multi-copper enzyme maturation permease subunit